MAEKNMQPAAEAEAGVNTADTKVDASANGAEKEKESDLIITLKTPYVFEGKEYTEIDLRKMEDLDGNDLFKANKVFMEGGYLVSKPETDPKFCYMIASLATNLPLEFFNRLPIRTANRVKETVFNFFQNED